RTSARTPDSIGSPSVNSVTHPRNGPGAGGTSPASARAVRPPLRTNTPTASNHGLRAANVSTTKTPASHGDGPQPSPAPVTAASATSTAARSLTPHLPAVDVIDAGEAPAAYSSRVTTNAGTRLRS